MIYFDVTIVNLATFTIYQPYVIEMIFWRSNREMFVLENKFQVSNLTF